MNEILTVSAGQQPHDIYFLCIASPKQVGKKYIAIVDGDVAETFSRCDLTPGGGVIQSLDTHAAAASSSSPQEEEIDLSSSPTGHKKRKLGTKTCRITVSITAPITGRYEDRPKQVTRGVCVSLRRAGEFSHHFCVTLSLACCG